MRTKLAAAELASLRPAAQTVVDAARRISASGLVVGTSGNASVRVCGAVADRELVLITPSGVDYETMQPEDVCVVSPAGEVHHARHAPSSELALHLDVYARKDVDAVVHTHSRHATALGCVADVLPPIHYGVVALGGPVPVVEYATFGTARLAELVATALDGCSAVILRNHGAVTVGADLGRATENAIQLEWMADVYLTALRAGQPRVLSAADLDDVARRRKALLEQRASFAGSVPADAHRTEASR